MAADARRFVEETWSATPLNRLNGRTPREAGNDAELAVKLAAAVHVLESVLDFATSPCDFQALRDSLGIAPSEPITVDDDALGNLSVMQLHRLALDGLSEEQLGHIVNRTLMIGHLPRVHAVLCEVDRRGVDKVPGLDENRFLQAMSQTCRDLGRRDEALEWIQKGRDQANEPDQFDERLTWEMRELSLRIEDRDDPKVKELIHHIWNYYGQKLPEIRENLRPLLEELGLPAPGETESGIILPGTSAVSEAAAAATSPDAPQEGGSKLWLPGQD